MNKLVKLFLLCVFTLMAPVTLAKDSDENYKPFKSRTDVMADITNALSQAKKENKRAIFVIGANWCHDSRSMAKKLASKEIAPLLNDHYSLSYINVGYYDEGMNVSQKFGLHTIYGTPTVMIIDPKTNALVNPKTVQKWRDASKISLADTVQYFKDHASKVVTDKQISASQKVALAKLSMFEKIQGLRLRKGYHHIGPMLRAYKEKKPLPSNFRAVWDELSDFRYQLTKDMKTIKNAIMNDPDKQDITLPTYKPFSWEQSK